MEEYGTCKASITKHERLEGVGYIRKSGEAKTEPIIIRISCSISSILGTF